MGDPVDVSTDIQIVESLEDQFFVLLEDDPNEKLEIKVDKKIDAKPCIESSNSESDGKDKILNPKEVEIEKKFHCPSCHVENALCNHVI